MSRTGWCCCGPLPPSTAPRCGAPRLACAGCSNDAKMNPNAFWSLASSSGVVEAVQDYVMVRMAALAAIVVLCCCMLASVLQRNSHRCGSSAPPPFPFGFPACSAGSAKMQRLAGRYEHTPARLHIVESSRRNRTPFPTTKSNTEGLVPCGAASRACS